MKREHCTHLKLHEIQISVQILRVLHHWSFTQRQLFLLRLKSGGLQSVYPQSYPFFQGECQALCHCVMKYLYFWKIVKSIENFNKYKVYLVKSGISEMSDSLYHIYRYHISWDLVDVPLLDAVLDGDMRRRECSRPWSTTISATGRSGTHTREKLYSGSLPRDCIKLHIIYASRKTFFFLFFLLSTNPRLTFAVRH